MTNLKNNYIKPLLIFVLFLSWFFLQYKHHQPLFVRVSLKTNSNTNVKAILSWDSGRGYTSYEQKELDFSAAKTSAEVTLPAMRIQRLKLESAAKDMELVKSLERWTVRSSNGRVKIDQFEQTGAVEITKIPKTEVFSKFLFVFQVFLAVICSFLTLTVFSFFRSQGGIKLFFAKRDEKYFLYTLIFLSSMYLLWVLAYWPVAMTNDSWSSLSDIKSLKFSDWHPYFYGFFVLSILNFYDSLGSLAVVQALATALTLSYGFYFCSKHGLKWIFLLPFILYAGFSIPIGTYNTLMWKDVPYSISVLLFSVLLFKYVYTKQLNNKKIALGSREQVLVTLCSLGIIFFRHNGIIYLPLLPIIFYFYLDKRSFRNISISLAACFVLFKIAIPSALDIKKPAGAPYQQMKLTLAIMTHPAFYSPTRDEDIKTIEDATKHSWQTLKDNYPQRWFWLWDNSEVCKNQWSVSGGQTANYNSAFLIKLIYYNVPIFLSEQTYGFLHSIGMDYTKSDHFDGFYEDPMQIFGSNLPIPGRELWGLVVHRTPPIPALTLTAENIAQWSMDFKGIFSPGFFIWGLPIIFLVMALILFIENPLSAISLYVLIHLLNAVFVFLIGAGESWRYFYNIYLSLFLLVPLWYLGRKAGKKQ